MHIKWKKTIFMKPISAEHDLKVFFEKYIKLLMLLDIYLKKINSLDRLIICKSLT